MPILRPRTIGIPVGLCQTRLAISSALALAPIWIEPRALLKFSWPFTCWFQHFIGIPCPTCGLTRSFTAMAHGDAMSAFTFHPLGPILYLIFIAIAIESAMTMIRGRGYWHVSSRFLSNLIFIALLANWCLQRIPVE